MQKEGSRQDYDLVGSYDNQRISSINAERTVNLFEFDDPQGKRPKVLLPTSGLVNTDLTFASGGSRQTFVYNNQKTGVQEAYQVFGNTVYRIEGTTGALVANAIGNLTTVAGYVGIDANTYQIIFVDGTGGYIWDINSTTFQQITDTGFPKKPIDVCYLDGFFLVANGDTNNFQLSKINQGMVWSGGSNQFPSGTFAADSATETLTLSVSNANFATGVPITLTTSNLASTTFTADETTDILAFPAGTTNANFQTGTTLKFTTTGTLPAPLNITDTYYSIAVSSIVTDPGTIKVASTYANALLGTAINITTNGTPPNTVSSKSTLPTPLTIGITYYVIRIGAAAANPGMIKLATSYENAIANIAINITDNGAPNNNILVSGELQLGSITSHPGTIVACNTLHRRIFLFSQNFTEVWENAGLGTNLPFRRNNSLLMEVGTPAIGSIQVGFDRMFFLAQDKDGLSAVMEVRGTESIPVSNRALDFQLAQYAQNPTQGVNDARGVLIKENGIIFYRLNFTDANHTFVLNVSMSTVEKPKWHEEEVLNGNRHPAQTHAYFNGVNYYGHYNLPIFYAVDNAISTNDGEHIRRMRIGRQMTPQGYNRLRIDRFQVDLLQGQFDVRSTIDITLSAEDGGGNPIAYLSVSKDGGQTYGNQLQAPMGKIGERTYRTVWRKLGTTPRGQGFVPKIEFYNDIPFVILGAAWDYEDLPE